MSAQHATPQQVRSRRGGAIGAMLVPVGGAGVGVALALALLNALIIPRLGLGGVQRIVEVTRRMATLDQTEVVFLGNSITVEGIDAGVVGSASGDRWTALNLGVNGCHIEELRVLTLALDRAHAPGAVVFSLQPVDLGMPQDVQIDKAFAYARTSAGERFRAGPGCDDLPGLTAESCAAIGIESVVRNETHFRGVPLNAFNSFMRSRLRAGVREADPRDFVAPFELTRSIGGPALQRHIGETIDTWRRRLDGAGDLGWREIERLLTHVASTGARPVAVIAPLRPEIAGAFEADLSRLRGHLRSLGGSIIFIDASGVAGPEDFADAIHMNASGRERYSRFVGEALARELGG